MAGKRGAPFGNQNATGVRMFTPALRAQLSKGNNKAMRTIIAKMVRMAQDGDPQMVKEVIDRVDGKAMQSIEVNATGDLGVIVVPGKGK